MLGRGGPEEGLECWCWDGGGGGKGEVGTSLFSPVREELLWAESGVSHWIMVDINWQLVAWALRLGTDPKMFNSGP